MTGASDTVPPQWRSLRNRLSENAGRWSGFDSVLAAVSFALLGGVTTAALQDRPPQPALIVVLVVVVAVARASWLFLAYGRPGTLRRDVGFYIGHWVLLSTLCAVEPSFGFYAWIGFVDAAAVLPRWISLVGITATALLVATSEVGGVTGVGGEPLTFVVLLFVNVVIAWSLGQFIGQLQHQSDERQQMILDLESAMQENARLQDRLVEQAEESGRADERARVARELHDTVAQGLIGIVAQLEAAEYVEDRATRLERARTLARSSLTEMRRAIVALSDPTLTAGLPAALDDACRQWSTMTDIPAERTTSGTERPGDADPELLRICQESLSNVARHARAGSVRVELDYGDDAVRLQVRDDGSGFDPDHVEWGFGVAGMRLRARKYGGTVDLDTAPGAGCTVTATVPLHLPEGAR